MSDISNQLIKDSYNYILQSDLSTGVVYRIGGGIPVNPVFLSGLTINSGFTYSNGTEQPGYVLTTDAFGNANWGPISGSSSGDYLPLSGGTVTGTTIFTDGLTSTTISATTYQNLPDTRFTGGTVSGATNFANGLTSTTISATTYQGLPIDVFVTGGTYTSGNAIFTNNTGGTFTVTGFPIGGGGGQVFYLNLSESQNGNRALSPVPSTSTEQSTGVTINNGTTGIISSFETPQLNVVLIPGGIWSFHLHSYKENSNASFEIFVEVYKKTSGGTQTLLFQTEPIVVQTNSPLVSMEITESYFSGTSIVVSDSVVAVVKATNTGNQPNTITFFTEGSQNYSYVISSLPTQQGLTCDTLSGCSIIQTIQTDVSNKLDKSGGTITGNLIINSGLTSNTISATTYQGINRSFGVSFDGMGSVILVNSQATLTIPYNMIIQSWVLLSDVTGSTVIDIWKDTYSNYPPTSGDSITALAKPTISSSNKNQSSTLTGWNTIVNSGDIIRFNVDSCTGMTRAQLTIIGKEF